MRQIRVLMILLLTIIGSLALSHELPKYLLTQADYQWMLGHNYSAFHTAYQIAMKHQASPGLSQVSEAEIRAAYTLFAPQRKVVDQMAAKSNSK